MSTLQAWLIFLLLAVVAAAITAFCRSYAPKDVKERLRQLEVESGYKCKIIYKGNPVVVIVERYSPRMNSLFVAIFTIMALIVFTFSGLFRVFSISIFGDCSYVYSWRTIIMSLLAHMIFWMVLSIISINLSESKFSVMKRYYEQRRAKVEIRYQS